MPLFLAAALVLFVFWLSSHVRSGAFDAYRSWFAEKHGDGVTLGVVVLLAIVVAALIVTVMQPGLYPQLEEVNASVLALLGAVISFDVRSFRRARSEP